MSCDLNLRGVKRKSSDEVECDSVGSTQTPEANNETRRQRVDNPIVTLPGAPVLPDENTVTNEDAFLDKTPDSSSSNSMSSSQSITDNDEDEDSEDEDEDEEDEFLEDESLADHLGDDSFGLVESESGYDELASSNSSASSSSSDFDFVTPADSFGLTTTAPPNASPNLAITNSSSVSSAPNFVSSAFSVTFNSNRIEASNTSCAYMSSTNSRRSAPSSYPSSRAFASSTSKDNNNHYHYLRKRQQIFNLSLCKLSRFRQSSDPSLLRSVLVCNTLRMLEKELEREGVKINFGPNGVSFISPVSSPSPDLDFVPAFQSPTASPTPYTDCAPVPESISFVGPSGPSTINNTINSTTNSSTTPENESYSYPNQCDPEYDKYFPMEGGSSSGRATPFLKSFPSSDYLPEAKTAEPAVNSAFWTNAEESATDRLSNLNWSSMLAFNSGNNSPACSPSGDNSLDPNKPRQSRSEVPMVPYDTGSTTVTTLEASNPTAPSITSSSCDSTVPTPTFATLSPAATTPPVSSSSQSTLLQVSSSVSSESYSLSSPSATNNLTYFSTASSSLPPYNTTSNQCSPISQQACGLSSTSSSNNTGFVNTPSLMSTSYINPYFSYSSNSDEIFGDIDLSLYDFDIFSPLSPPSVATKSGPIMSAEELIRNISSSDCNSSVVCSNSSNSSLLSLSHFTVNGFSGQSYTSSNYCTSSSSMTNVVSSITTSSSSLMSQTVTMPSAPPVSCGSSSTGSGLHLHSASGRYYKTSEDRDQTITTIKCHN